MGIKARLWPATFFRNTHRVGGRGGQKRRGEELVTAPQTGQSTWSASGDSEALQETKARKPLPPPPAAHSAPSAFTRTGPEAAE